MRNLLVLPLQNLMQSYTILRQQRGPIYLKPKGKTSESPNQSAAEKDSNNTNDTGLETENETVSFSETHANENTDVVRSELKSLRQSAVAMSVSQKDGANEIVKDWLDDNKEDSDKDASGDEEN